MQASASGVGCAARFRFHDRRGQPPNAVKFVQRAGCVAFNGRKARGADNFRIFFVAVAGFDEDPVDHLPFDAVPGAFQMPGAISPVDQGPLQISTDAQPRTGCDENDEEGLCKKRFLS